MAKSSTKSKRDSKGRFAKATASQFPQINRLITAPRTITVQDFGRILASVHFWRWFIAIVILSILILQLVQLGQNLYANYNEAQLKQAEKRGIEAEIAKWQNVVKGRPDYRDGYFELAILTYRLGRTDETRNYLKKVFELDPNYQPAREFEKKL